MTRFLFLLSCFLVSCGTQPKPTDDQDSLAKSRRADLQLGVYITAQAVDGLLSTDAGRREAILLLRSNGITKVYLEVYRSGLAVRSDVVKSVNDFFQQNGFETAGGIATVPGENFGVRQEGRLGFFNWENAKTQTDLLKVMQEAALIFKSFIVDDFLCTADTSAESKKAKGTRSWSRYRQDLLVSLSKSLFIDPVKKINPKINVIIKYPQWYDRFQLFGYDVVREPEVYDQVWVGTETRGQFTRSFGFVQPYEGFISYRWMSSLAGKKMGGAWFDHIDCDDSDFIDQAYQSVLAGAKELIIFNYYNLVFGHEGHHRLRQDFEKLADLAQAVAKNPVYGVAGYKPPHSDAGGDLYMMDYIGMLGVPLIPVSVYPENSKVIFLPTQAAADSSIYSHIIQSLKKGSTLIVTSGFLAHALQGKELAEMAGLHWPISESPQHAKKIIAEGKLDTVKYGLNLGSSISVNTASVLLEAVTDQQRIPFLTKSKEGQLFVLNSHTFSQADFDAIKEVLLSPRPLGLLEIPASWATALRHAFNAPLNLNLDAPTRVALQPLAPNEYIVHNYNQKEVSIEMKLENEGSYTDILSGNPIPSMGHSIKIILPARSRIWLQSK